MKAIRLYAAKSPKYIMLAMSPNLSIRLEPKGIMEEQLSEILRLIARNAEIFARERWTSTLRTPLRQCHRCGSCEATIAPWCLQGERTRMVALIEKSATSSGSERQRKRDRAW